MHDHETAMPPLPDVRLVQDGRIWRVDPALVPALMDLEPMVRHAVHHRICQSVYAQTKGAPPEPADRTFIEKGVVTLPRRIPKALARRLSRFATEILSSTGQTQTLGTPTDEFRVDDANVTINIPPEMHSVFLDLLPVVIDRSVEESIESYLGSFFRIDHCSLYRTRRTEEPLVSFRWHRDLASMGQIHIMLYLTPSGDEGGATEFIPLEDTRSLARAGYSFVNPDARTSDFDELLDADSSRPEIVRPMLAAGDAAMFGATRVLHRGVQPRDGFRDVFLIVLLPSTVPWRIELEQLGRDHLLIASDKEAYMSNPFVAFNPTHRDFKDGRVHGTKIPPIWSQLAYFWPPQVQTHGRT